MRDSQRIFALAADYLVDAIAQATRDVSTGGTQEAEHLLNYYKREAIDKFRPRWWVFSDPVIPWSKLRFIMANADKASQRKPEVALLLTRSTWRHYARTAGLGAAIVVGAVVLATPLTLQSAWRLEEVKHHWPAGLRGRIGMLPAQVGSRTVIAPRVAGVSARGISSLRTGMVAAQTGPLSSDYLVYDSGREWFGLTSKAYLRLWSPQDGRRLACASGSFWTGVNRWDRITNLTLLQVRTQSKGSPPKILLRALDALDTPPKPICRPRPSA